MIPPELVTTVCGGEVNDAYLDYVVLLKTRLEYAREVQTGGLAQTAAGQELLPDLERLRVRAVSKVSRCSSLPPPPPRDLFLGTSFS